MFNCQYLRGFQILWENWIRAKNIGVEGLENQLSSINLDPFSFKTIQKVKHLQTSDFTIGAIFIVFFLDLGVCLQNVLNLDTPF